MFPRLLALKLLLQTRRFIEFHNSIGAAVGRYEKNHGIAKLFSRGQMEVYNFLDFTCIDAGRHAGAGG
jgi:hypothetical protein